MSKTKLPKTPNCHKHMCLNQEMLCQQKLQLHQINIKRLTRLQKTIEIPQIMSLKVRIEEFSSNKDKIAQDVLNKESHAIEDSK